MSKLLSACVISACLMTHALVAQSLTSISGLVTDPSGASVPSASITLTNNGTQAKRQAVTAEDGRYNFLQVPPGTYSLSVQAAGFGEKVVNEIRLLVNTPATLDIQFEKVNANREIVSVSADALQVNTQDATLGNTFSTKPIVQLPFEGRNVVGLLSLQPGVTYLGDNPDNADDERSGSVNGGKSDQANVTLDGVDVNNQQGRNAFTSVLRVTLDSVQEFRVVTTNANADMGRTSGAQVTLVTKSGTNELHGSLYEYLRNKATNANYFFNNSAVSPSTPNGVPLNKLNRNVYGVSLGGPLRKNRLFYFANWEGRKDRQEVSTLRTIPTATLRAGILQYPTTNGGVGTLDANAIAQKLDPLHIGPNQAVMKLFQQYPLPNDVTTGDGYNTAGYRFNAPTRLDWNTYIARLDYVLDEAAKNTLFFRGNLQNDRSTTAPQFPGLPANRVDLNNSKGLAAGVNSLLRPNWINTFRYGYTREGIEQIGTLNTPLIYFRTIDTLNGQDRYFRRLTPVHNITDDVTWNKGSHTVQFGMNLRGIQNSRLADTNSYATALGNRSWLAGSGNVLSRPISDLDPGFALSFRTAATAVLGLLSEGTGNYNYDKNGNLLAQGTRIPRTFANKEYEFYVQDSWKMRRNLTATYGVRWSLMPPIYEVNGYQTNSVQPLSQWFDQRVALANAGLPQSMVQPVSYTLSDMPGGRSFYPFHKDNFAPRLALAYSPEGSGWTRWLTGGPGKTSIRAGFGMFYDLFGSGLVSRFDGSALGLTSSITNPAGELSVANVPRYVNAFTVPSAIIATAPKGGFPAVAPDAFAIINSLDDNIKAPYTFNLNFSVAREFGKGFFIQGSYVGRLSHRTLTSEDIATPTDIKDPKSGIDYFTAAKYLARLGNQGVDVSQVKPNPFWENLFPGLAGGGLTATQVAYTLYGADPNSYQPDYTSALQSIDYFCDPSCSIYGPNTMFNSQYSYLRVLRSIGKGSYHSMQWTARKRFGNGDQIEFNWTWSHSIDLGSAAERTTNDVISNPYNRTLFRASSNYDLRHQFNANFLYNLPFGSNKTFFNTSSKLVDAFIGGWQIAGLYRQTTGFPTSIDNGGAWPTNWNIEGNATQIAPVTTGSYKNAPAPSAGSSGGPNIFPNPAQAINAFVQSLPGDYGDRNNIRGDGLFNIDASLAKRWAMPYKEGHSLQFRWEVFNVTNTTRFDPYFASTTYGDAGSFGKYTSTLTNPRVMQFALRYEF